MSDREHARLARFVIVGVFANLVVATLQLSFSGATTIRGLLPYDIRLGMFANENHFSTLVFISIPLAAWHWTVRDRKPLHFVAFCLLVLPILFAAGSRAGVLLALVVMALSLLWVSSERRSLAGLYRIAVVAAILAAAFFSIWLLPQLGTDQRLTYTRHTLEALREHWLLGSGLGSFAQVYASHEEIAEISRNFVNHAHNDWLELWLETGVFGPALAIGFLVLVARHSQRSALAAAASLAIAAVAIHSLVDYPLRTFAIGVPFVYLCAIALSVRAEDRPSRIGERHYDAAAPLGPISRSAIISRIV